MSNLGRVKRLEVEITRYNQFTSWLELLPERLFTPSPNPQGYPQVSLTIGKKRRVARVHRLVAEAFLSPPSQQLIDSCKASGLGYVSVNHIDNDVTNSIVSNLEWCNTKHNVDWTVESGRHVTKCTKGIRNVNNVLSDTQVMEILDHLKMGKLSQTEIAELYNVKQITISNIWTGRSWTWLTGISPKERSRKFKIKAIKEQGILKVH